MPSACEIPLPGMLMTDEQKRVALDWWEKLCDVQRDPAYQAKRVDWQEAKVAALSGLLGATDGERIAAQRLRSVLADLPDQVLTTWGGLALAAARQTEEPAQERVPATFRTPDAAAAALNTGAAFERLTEREGWKILSILLAGFAWALAWCIGHCKAGDEPFYIEARRQVVQMFNEIQAAIDRGVDAVAWLKDAAEREKETH